MDNAGDWLYIVFLIISAVSIFTSSKKEKKKPTVVLEHPDGQLNIPPKKSTRFKKKAKIEQAPTPPQKEEGGSYISNYVSPYAKEVAEQAPESAVKIELNSAEEARKAFIYSEIFSRKF